MVFFEEKGPPFLPGQFVITPLGYAAIGFGLWWLFRKK